MLVKRISSTNRASIKRIKRKEEKME